MMASHRRFAAARCPFSKLAAALVLSIVAASARADAPAAQNVAAPAPAEPSAEPCTPYNLLPLAAVSGAALEGNAAFVRDGRLAQEGTTWNDAGYAVQLKNPGGEIVIDLREPHSVRYLVLQGDNNDYYSIEGSLDGASYRALWNAEPVTTGWGLRTRWVELPKGERVRYLRVRGSGGDGYYSLSEVRASCDRPKAWPPPLVQPPKQSGWHGIDNDGMVAIKGWGSAIGALLLIVIALWKNPPKPARIALDGMLALMGLFGFFSWWNLGHYHFDHYEHTWEHYHYWIGAKYGPELRYARLYECTGVADVEDGWTARVKKREMRDLALTNELGPSDDVIKHPERCKQHFTPERWKAFRDDIRFFRGRFTAERWDESQTDHGYNATPVWAVVGRLIADHDGVLDWDELMFNAWIDSAFLVAMWAVSWWAFGWRPTCVALMWWGFNFPARFYWNGGSFLRYDWLLWLVVGICLLRKRYHFAAGMALTYSTLLRIFPGFVVAAVILKALARIVRHRRLLISRGHLRFAAGCIVALAIAIPASGWAAGGLESWKEFAQNSKKHLSTALTNNMGLKTALGYDAVTSAKYMRDSALHDPFATWKDAREFFYHKRAPVLYAILILFCIMLARAGDREPDWVAACLGAGLIAMAAELTCYYYGFLLAYGLIWDRHKFPGIAATVLSGLTCLLYFSFDWNDDHFAGMSLATSITIVAVTAFIAFAPREGERRATQSDEAHDEPPHEAPAMVPASSQSRAT